MQGFTRRSSVGYEMRAGGHCRPIRVPRSVFHVCAVAGVVLATPCVAQEKPAEIIAAHVRTQGYACENALAAQRDRKASKPNETVWTLRCSNGTYRVRLVPDMAAHVERVQPAKSK
jgi:hypothetical protein